MTAIQVRKTAEEPGAASLAVTVPAEQVQQAEARATSAYQRRARLPGFRKGKAPAALVKKQFADDIRQQALEELVRGRGKETRRRTRGPFRSCWVREARSRRWRRRSWACSPGKRWTPPCASRPTSPRRRSAGRRGPSVSRCRR